MSAEKMALFDQLLNEAEGLDGFGNDSADDYHAGIADLICAAVGLQQATFAPVVLDLIWHRINPAAISEMTAARSMKMVRDALGGFGERDEHVFLTAFVVASQQGREHAQRHLLGLLPQPDGTVEKETYLDSWWIAEDDRLDGSDCGSAVFVPGDGNDPDRLTQQEATRILLNGDQLKRGGHL